MKTATKVLFVTVVAVVLLAVCAVPGKAGRTGGPTSTTVLVPAYQTVNLDMPFNEKEMAIVTVQTSLRGTRTVVSIYDSDGNVTRGVNRKNLSTAVMDVYRGGMFRVELANLGPVDDLVMLTTN